LANIIGCGGRPLQPWPSARRGTRGPAVAARGRPLDREPHLLPRRGAARWTPNARAARLARMGVGIHARRGGLASISHVGHGLARASPGPERRLERDSSEAKATFHASSDRFTGGSTADAATTPFMKSRNRPPKLGRAILQAARTPGLLAKSRAPATTVSNAASFNSPSSR
jgi:hypothetical protein